MIADIDKAPVNAAGKVEFSGDICILRPLNDAAANGVALVDVVNRGRKTIVTTFDSRAQADPAADADLGDAFLTRQGYTLVFVAWEFDVRRSATSMGLDVPGAPNATGVVRGVLIPNDANPEQTVTDLGGYQPAQADAADTTLVVHDGPFGKVETIARNRFTLKGNTITLTGGFTPGRTYELSYRPQILPGVGARHGGVSRRGHVGQARARRARARTAGDCVRVVAERPVPAHVPLLRIQHRRTRRAGVRRRDGAHRRAPRGSA